LEGFGLKVYRISDIAVKRSLAGVMYDLEDYIVREYAATPVSDHPAMGGE